MAAEFIGYAVLVTLQNPSGAQIHGVVSNVINQKLYLRDGKSTASISRSRLTCDSCVARNWSTIRFVYVGCLEYSRPRDSALATGGRITYTHWTPSAESEYSFRGSSYPQL